MTDEQPRGCPLCKKLEGGPHDPGCQMQERRRGNGRVIGFPKTDRMQVIRAEELRPGDTLVFNLADRALPPEQITAINTFMAQVFPEQRHIVLLHGQKLKVVRSAKRITDAAEDPETADV